MTYDISGQAAVQKRVRKPFYLPVRVKFVIANLGALAWFFGSMVISYPWIGDLSRVIGGFLAWYIVLFIALVPGYLNFFLIFSLCQDKPEELNLYQELPDVSILIAAFNEEDSIGRTLRSLKEQDYPGRMIILIVDDGSTDKTAEVVEQAGMENVVLIRTEHTGKPGALNLGLDCVRTGYVITIDADTCLHPQAVRRIMARMMQAPLDTAAVAGCVLVKNSRASLMTRMQEWDYFLAISSVKRQQSLYRGTLVAQGAFSVYKTEVLRSMNGWPACVGEDIVLTWSILKAGYRAGFEATAIGFTKAPAGLAGFARQRRRWARGLIEGFKTNYGLLFKGFRMASFLVALDLLFPVMDFTYTFIFIPGIILAFFGRFDVAGPLTFFILPLTFFVCFIIYKHQRRVFDSLKLKIRRNWLGFIFYALFYQLLMSPKRMGIWGGNLGKGEEMVNVNTKPSSTSK